MDNKHGYCSTMRCACMDVDALNATGIYTTAALDNGVMVKVVKMVQNAKNYATGFEYEVTPATQADVDVWIVDTPEVGSNVEMQAYSDPRTFYNEAGRPMSIKKLLPGIDQIEVIANNFTDGALPTTAKKYCAIGAGGKLTASASAPSSKGAYFELVALHTIDIGAENVPSAILAFKKYEA